MIHHGDCLEVMATLPEASVDAVVTDPPYGLEFMGKGWDRLWDGRSRTDAASPGYVHPVKGKAGNWRNAPTYRAGFAAQEWHHRWAREAFRVLKPGGYLLAFGGTRTYHRLASAIEDAGFEIRDTLVWAYASGFPKSLDVSKALDKAAGAEREKVATGNPVKRMIPGADQNRTGDWTKNNGREYQPGVELPATDLAKQWQGWGTALKPAWEPIVMARKPLVGSVAQNVTRYGTGAINVDGCRIGMIGENVDKLRARSGGKGERPSGALHGGGITEGRGEWDVQPAGRWPANVILTDPIFDGGVDGVVGGGETARAPEFYERSRTDFEFTSYPIGKDYQQGYGDSGTYSRFFLIPKADRADREPVLRGQLELGPPPGSKRSKPAEGRQNALGNPRENAHPTVKPTELMRHLVRLVTPPGGVILDPFLGSGTTAIAAEMEGFAWIGIEKEAEYVAIAEARLNGVQRGLGLDVPAPTRKAPKTHPDLSKHQPKRRAAAENYSGGWTGTEDAA